MSVERESQGQESADRGELAERTFADMLRWWLSGTGAHAPSQLLPDSQKVDIKITIPSLWAGVENIDTNWQIKATSRRPPDTVHLGLGCRCLKFRMSKRDIQALRDYARSYPNLYVALAIQRDPDMRTADLYSLPPSERFDWFVVDAKQQLEAPNEGGSAIYFPTQNQLNMAMFSLLWGANWVANFFAPLCTSSVVGVAGLSSMIPRVFNTVGRLDDQLLRNWNLLLRDLPKYRPELDDELFKKINFRLGLGNAVGIIRKEMYTAAGRLEQIRNYCPEALYGTTNLWLFSRIYRQFMDTTSDVADGVPDFVNQRLLPLGEEDPDRVPRMLRCALWHVAIVYTLLGVEVRIIMKPPNHFGEDHSYYGGGIGYLPWASLTPDQAYWMVENDTSTTLGEHIDFLNAHVSNVYMTTPTNLSNVAQLLGMDASQLHLPSRCPVQLFPPESIFLRYPHELFGPGRYRAIASGYLV